MASTNPTASRRGQSSESGALPNDFIRRTWPWLIAAGFFVVYLLTLNRWISFSNMLGVVRGSGWLWQPDLCGPVTWLVTLPFRALPEAMRPIALNAFSAVCGALSIGLLARTVALWPHDRTHDQRQKERGPYWLLSVGSAWMPPLLAALICGLQLTFWEQATSIISPSAPWGSGCEMFDLLLFAYVVCALLRFRLDQDEKRLFRASLVYGLALTNNWAMVGYLPLFIASLIWIRGLAFFNTQFLVRMFLCGLGGALLYLLLPIVQSATNIAHVPFWTGLSRLLGSEFGTVSTVFHYFKGDPQSALVLALPSMIPLVLISIKWASYFGDTSRLGVALTTLAFHLVHAVFFLVCIWVAFDPPFSARFNLLSRAVGVPFLSLGFISAVAIGYCAGYFLLVFSSSDQKGPRKIAWLPYVEKAVTVLVWIIAVSAPLLLVCKNFGAIRASNGNTTRKYASALVKQLPREPTVVLSDDPRKLVLAEAEAQREKRADKLLFLDTSSLPFPDYLRFVKKRYGSRWGLPMPKENTQRLADLDAIGILQILSQSNRLYYIHPSFGFYFELFYAIPHGLAYELKKVSTNSLETPLPAPEVIKENENFWAEVQRPVIDPMIAAVNAKPPSSKTPLGWLYMKAHIKTDPNHEISTVGGFYSRALDYWGVELQRTGNFKEAEQFFQRAQQLNPDNVVARINLEFNRNYQAGKKVRGRISSDLQEDFGKYRDWNQVMNENGPFDEPLFCFQEGLLYTRNNLYRQAAYQFERTTALETNNLAARIALAQVNIVAHHPDEALQIVSTLRSNSRSFGLSSSNITELLYVEASAHVVNGNLAAAEQDVREALEKSDNAPAVLATAASVYTQYGAYTNAVQIMDKQLEAKPNDQQVLMNKGFACIQMGAYTNGIEALNKVLNMETNTTSELYNTALLDRAIAYLKSGQLDLAQKDYETLEKNMPSSYRIHFGLAEVAYQKRDTNSALRNYRMYLSNAPTNTPEAKEVQGRMKELKPGYP